MFLSVLRIENFRRLQKAELAFQPGLNVIVGENNSGKTAIIEAIRSVLDDRKLDVDDLRFDKTKGKSCETISVEAQFDGLDIDDEAAFNQALIPGMEIGKYRARLAVSGAMRGDEMFRTFEAGAGPNTGAFYDVLNARRIFFLPALRDPTASGGLRPGTRSRQAELLRRITDDANQQEMIKIAMRANADLKATPPVNQAAKIVQSNLRMLTGPVYAQDADLSFVDPEFSRLIAQLEGRADGLPVGLNGLGYGNIYFIAAVLGDFDEEGKNPKRYRALLIEEPEAHLHPHHQILLLRFLEQRAEQQDRPIQIFVTTHSPILASQAAMSGLLPLIDVIAPLEMTAQANKKEASDEESPQEVITKASPIEMEGSREQAARVNQYVDATRSELFFARRLLMVEGDAERILLPVLIRRIYAEVPEALGITIVSAAGLNFAQFLPFIGSSVLNVPVAIVTDGDPPARQIDGDELEHSAYVKKLQTLVADDRRIEVFPSTVTFEYDLAVEAENAEVLLTAMERVRPVKTQQFREMYGAIRGKDFAERFYDEFFKKSRTSKAEFAMEVALILKRDPQTTFAIPRYLSDAFEHVLEDFKTVDAPKTDA